MKLRQLIPDSALLLLGLFLSVWVLHDPSSPSSISEPSRVPVTVIPSRSLFAYIQDGVALSTENRAKNGAHHLETQDSVIRNQELGKTLEDPKKRKDPKGPFVIIIHRGHRGHRGRRNHDHL